MSALVGNGQRFDGANEADQGKGRGAAPEASTLRGALERSGDFWDLAWLVSQSLTQSSGSVWTFEPEGVVFGDLVAGDALDQAVLVSGHRSVEVAVRADADLEGGVPCEG